MFRFSKLNVKKIEGLRPSIFFTIKIEFQNYFKILNFSWFSRILLFHLKSVEFWNSFTKYVWNTTEIQHFLSKMCSFRCMNHFKVEVKFELLQNPALAKIPKIQGKSYDVPLWCFIKVTMWDIETFETALDSSDPVLFRRVKKLEKT